MRRLPRTLTYVLAAGALFSAMLLFAACDDDDDSTPASGTTPALTGASPGATATTGGPSPSPVLGAASEPQKVDVTARDFSFDPDKLALNKSTAGNAASSVTVNFTNGGRASHTFTLYSDKEYKTKVGGAEITSTPGGGSGSSTFVAPTAATTYFFRCEIHNSMQGTIEFK